MIQDDFVLSQRRELERYASELSYTKRKLLLYLAQIDAAWSGPEVQALNVEIRAISNKLYRLCDELNRLGKDVWDNYEQLKEEEEAEEEMNPLNQLK